MGLLSLALLTYLGRRLAGTVSKEHGRRRVLFRHVFALGFALFVYLTFVRPATWWETAGALSMPAAHGTYGWDTPTLLRYIFPGIEYADTLKTIGTSKLLRLMLLVNDKNEVHARVYRYPDHQLLAIAANQYAVNALLMEQVATANMFETGRKVYRGDDDVAVVVVTLVDYDLYSTAELTAVMQNRVDYARKHGYGVYSRWAQEMFPLLLAGENGPEWVPVLMMQAALHAFPKAKYIWYLEADAMIADLDVDFVGQVARGDVLDRHLVRDVQVSPLEGVIKTYVSTKGENVKMFAVRRDSGLDLRSWVLVNDLEGKAFLGGWAQPLTRHHQLFRSDPVAALAHILLWHPTWMKRFGLVEGRVMSGVLLVTAREEDREHFQKGDFVVSFQGCKERGTCGEDILSFGQA